jgi:hypothetical protein
MIRKHDGFRIIARKSNFCSMRLSLSGSASDIL